MPRREVKKKRGSPSHGAESSATPSKRRKKAAAPAGGGGAASSFEDHLRIGFLLAVLPCSDSVSHKHNSLLRPGAHCILTAQGVMLDDDVLQAPLHLPYSSQNDEEGAGNSKRRAASSSSSGSSILVELHKMACKNGARVEGHVIKLVPSSSALRVVVLLDVLLPPMLCMNLESWKPSHAAAFAMSHLSCDWQRRKQVLSLEPPHVDDELVRSVGDCRVLGCTLHPGDTTEKKKRFDLIEIFKLLSPGKRSELITGCISAADDAQYDSAGLWDVPDEILTSVLTRLLPRDLASIAAACKHTRQLATPIIPCMNLRLFPHQEAAVQWMLHRETHPGRFNNPMYSQLQTEDGFHLYVNSVTGDLSLEQPDQVDDFRGGLFCDEPGLGKTITALSLILKTQGTFPSPPPAALVSWCDSQSGDRIGYYEVAGGQGMSQLKRCVAMKGRRGSLEAAAASPPSSQYTTPPPSRTRRKLLLGSPAGGEDASGSPSSPVTPEPEPAWVQCDGCKKWRKLARGFGVGEEGTGWFCRMNPDPVYQSCSVAEEGDAAERIHSFSIDGFHKAGSQPGSEQNVAFFTSILQGRASVLTLAQTRKALNWLADLAPSELVKMANQGVSVPQHLRMASVSGSVDHEYQKLFQAFGLVVMPDKKKVIKWHYPGGLKSLYHLDTAALRAALAQPVEEVSRIYLSKATLVVVPANLVQHWQAQIQRHTSHKQLRVYVCVDSKNTPMPHGLAWDYDVVITTFSRLSTEWSSREHSLLMQIHWLRIILDEGHTLGASVTLTNKLQMAVNMRAARRWVLTGTPTPGTPNTQLVNLHPMLRFLHDQVYGRQVKVWDAAIARPFEALCEEGRVRVVQLLGRCMISGRKADLCSIPACVRRMKVVEFTQEHAGSYNGLVETVRRNLLMADWNDPDHVESLLNPKQWKLKARTLRNVRLSCCVAGQVEVHNVNQDIQETMDMIVERGVSAASNEYHFIRTCLLVGGNCMRCGEWCRLPLLTPCRHFLCLSCVALDCERCSVLNCGKPYMMQKPKARLENPNPKWPVPQDLIELQPSYTQDEWHPEWQSTSSSKVAYLIDQLQVLRQEEADQPPPKAIVFSQFLEHISVIESQLTKAGIQHAGMYSPMHSHNKMKALKSFQDDPACLVLLMDGSSALGLDLSFVNRVYLMEPIWDRSMEEQVVSRAHRMGATRPVFVETLAMSGTIEEQMLQFLQDASLANRTHQDAQYLSHLSFVRQNTMAAAS